MFDKFWSKKDHDQPVTVDMFWPKNDHDQPVSVELSAEDYAFLEKTAESVGLTPSVFLSCVIKSIRPELLPKK